MTSFLGPFATFGISSVVGLIVDLIGRQTFNPSDISTLIGISFIIGIYGFVFVLPGASLLALAFMILQVRTRISYIVASTIFGLAYILGAPALLYMLANERPLLPILVSSRPEDFAFLAAVALSGALCGDVYWRMAVKPLPLEPERTVEPPMA